MGAWGVRAFDNDEANDWACDLEGADDLSPVEAAFAAVEQATDYLEAPEAERALAACEVLARLNGKARYTNSTVDMWVAAHAIQPSAGLLDRANAIIDRVLANNSELKELWSDSDRDTDWLASVEDLRTRLRG